jgi:diguanylate cyclase (GGDEF)-like protein
MRRSSDKSIETRFGAVMRSERRDEGAGVPYLVQYCLRTDAAAVDEPWVEDSGRWFAGADGRPARAHGVVRVINDRHQHEQRLDNLSRFDALTGELNRWYLLQALAETLEEAIRFRASCGFLLVAIDALDHLNESYGFNIADEVIAAVARRIRGRLRGGDCVGRISGNRFGVVLKSCGADDLRIAASRLLAGVRDDMVPRRSGRWRCRLRLAAWSRCDMRTADEVLVRAQKAIGRARAKRLGSFQPTGRAPSAKRSAARTRVPPTRSSPRSTSGASRWCSSRWRGPTRARPRSASA